MHAEAPVRPLPSSLAALVAVNGLVCALATVVGGLLALESWPEVDGLAFALLVLLCAGTAGLCAGLLRRRRPAGRRLQIGLAAVGLLGVPFWTAASVWTLVVVGRRAGRTLLSGRGEEAWSGEEAAAVRRALARAGRGRTVLVASGLAALMALQVAALVALPDLGGAARARQKRTIADMRSLMAAIEAYAVDHGAYPPTAPVEELRRLLQPAYGASLPGKDAWGHPLRYEAWKEKAASPGPDSYVLASPGKDGRWDGPDPRTVAPGDTSRPEDDLVLRDGSFVRAPGLSGR